MEPRSLSMIGMDTLAPPPPPTHTPTPTDPNPTPFTPSPSPNPHPSILECRKLLCDHWNKTFHQVSLRFVNEQQRTTMNNDRQQPATTNHLNSVLLFPCAISLYPLPSPPYFHPSDMISFLTTIPLKAAAEFPPKTVVPPSEVDASSAPTRKAQVHGKHMTPQKHATE